MNLSHLHTCKLWCCNVHLRGTAQAAPASRANAARHPRRLVAQHLTAARPAVQSTEGGHSVDVILQIQGVPLPLSDQLMLFLYEPIGQGLWDTQCRPM